MPRDGFQSGDVVNRRVTGHIKSLLPGQTSDQKDYHFEGQRAFSPEQVPGEADSCLCYLEAYVGGNGQFDIHEHRRFAHETGAEWHCTNRIARTAGGTRSLDPFEYRVRTTLELAGQTRTDRSRVDWATLGDDPIFGGKEAQAATLLAEKMAHRKARETSRNGANSGSLSHLGSLSNVIDSGRQLPVDWLDVDELLGPDADTIAASTGFEQLTSDEKRYDARRKGIDFLSDTLEEDVVRFEESLQSGRNPAADARDGREAWKRLPPDMDETTAMRKITEMQEQLQEMRDEMRL